MSVLIVTGTGTDVGKTVVTAALASLRLGAPAVGPPAAPTPAGGRRPTDRLAVVKPVQTGVDAGEPGDLAEIGRLAGAGDPFEFARYPDPLSPEAAARTSGRPELTLGETAERIRDLAGRYDDVLVEGAGGLLVSYARNGWTLFDLAVMLDAPVLVVALAGLGTMNHTALTLRALGGHPTAGVVIGRWPDAPDLAQRCNVGDLADLAARHTQHGLLGALDEGIGAATVAATGVDAASMGDFSSRARLSLAPELGGEFDAGQFVAKWRQ